MALSKEELQEIRKARQVGREERRRREFQRRAIRKRLTTAAGRALAVAVDPGAKFSPAELDRCMVAAGFNLAARKALLRTLWSLRGRQSDDPSVGLLQ